MKQKFKIPIPQFVRNIVVHMHTKYRKDRMKNEGAYPLWKRFDRRQTTTYDDGQLGIG